MFFTLGYFVGQLGGAGSGLTPSSLIFGFAMKGICINVMLACIDTLHKQIHFCNAFTLFMAHMFSPCLLPGHASELWSARCGL